MATWGWVYLANLRGPQGVPGPPGWSVGNLPASTDLFTFADEGLYYVANATGMVNWPTWLGTVGGHVEFRNKSGVKSITIYSFGARAGVYSTQTNSVGSNTFMPWRRIDTDYQGRLDSGADALDLTRPDGRYSIESATTAAAITNLPTGVAVPGYLTYHTMSNVGLGVRFVEYEAQGTAVGGLYRNWTVTTVGTHTWSGWQKIATKADVDAVSATVQPLGLNQTGLRDEFSRRRGGKIGTNPKAVVALRFDDPINGLINSGVDVTLSDLGIPASSAHCSGSFTATDLIALSNLGTWDTVKDWAHKQGLEVWHHGGNHQDASGTSALTGQIVTSLATLKTSLPTLEVNKWMQPGVGGTNYDGFASADAAELFFEHTAGKLLSTGHSVMSGYMPGLLRQLDGKPRNGLTHFTVDTPANLTAVYDHIDAAIEDAAGLCIMVHPNNLDRVGDFSTSADFKDLLQHLADLRDAGSIEILTVSGLLCADSSTLNWAQVVRDGSFAGGLAKWLGTGWTVSSGVASTAGTNNLSQSHSMLRYGWMRGGTMQLKAEVRATTGAVVRLHQSSDLDSAAWTAEKDFTLPASSDWVTLRLNACVPLTLSADDYAWTRLARVSGGTVEVRNVEYRPV
ncbi:hypothetical protein [Arthrobacter sp. StoSoilB13]|uniref:hypothetical protein n=1 Tax=Arthrobacter sp. StoSoilB13 TaxID=2830993 RepID=UPI001CC7D1A5|nr:hypothetical protein [Arthrobacter sp. StoSoilB13]BCW47894.1 hypothetical protein StoSoilB13_02360 [Arthrobacter sp. StoSoilB13]